MSASGQESSAAPITDLAVVGAGTMGSGIALAALYAGCRVRLYDVSAEVLDDAVEYISKHLERKDLSECRDKLTTHDSLAELEPAQLWVEAVPEDLELKQKIFRQMEQRAGPSAILATNTSTLPVASITGVLDRPGRALGLHFFNPAAVMPLVEVIGTDETDDQVVRQAMDFVASLEKTGIKATDTPGFIVNRVARPFYSEALLLLSEGLATIQQIDRLVEGLGFPMGPFRLMDLIGNDVNLAATRSVFEQSFFEPRYRPSLIQQRLVQGGKLGKKSGQGFYKYPLPEPDTQAAARKIDRQSAPSVFLGAEDFAPGLRELLLEKSVPIVSDSAKAEIVVLADSANSDVLATLDRLRPQVADEALLLVQTVSQPLARWQRHWPRPDQLFGFDSLMAAQAEGVELVSNESASDESVERLTRFLSAIDRFPVWVTDGPGLVLPRIVAMLVNEAAFATQERVAAPEQIDQAMRLGVRYPRGPFEWSRLLGPHRILEVLEALQREHGDPRYRSALLLRRLAESAS